MITISHNELVVACRKAFEALGFPHGQAEDGANSIGWLLLHGLPIPDEFLSRLDRLKPVSKLPGRLDSGETDQSVWNAHGASGLSCFPNLADFASVQAGSASTHRMTVENMADIDLVWPYLVNLQMRGYYAHLKWVGPSQIERGVVFSAQAEPDCYWLNLNSNGHCRAIELVVSQEPLAIDPSEPIIRIEKAEGLQANYRDRTQNGVSIENDIWDRLNLLGKKLLVESTAESEQRGAGGV